MSPRGRFNLVMGLLVAGALAFGFWRWRQQAEHAAVVSAQIAAHAAQARNSIEDRNRVGTAREERGPPLQAPPSVTPLPPWGEPLGANFDALRRRADAGDARAACRIGVELSLCAGAQAPPDPAADAQSAPGTPSALARYCEGVDASMRGQAATYLRKAALAGNTDAMLRYASGAFSVQATDPHSHNEFLQDPVFGDWYNEALPMAQRALHAGDPLAAQLLANAYADDDGLFDARVPNDPIQARAYEVLLAYLRSAAPPPPGDLDARQRAQADAQAQRIFRESFGSQPVKGGVPTDPGLDAPPRPGQRPACD